MNEFLTYVKNSSLSVSDPSTDSSLPMLGSPETLANRGLLMDSIQTLRSFKSSLEDQRRKDQLLRDNFLESVKGSSFSKLESDIAKQSIRDYESSLTLVRYLQSENEHLKRRNALLEREAEDARTALGHVQE